MKKLFFLFALVCFTKISFSQTIPPPYINYQAVLYDVNGPNPNAVLSNQSFDTYVNIQDELGNLLYKEQHYASTDANGQVTIKIGDGDPDTLNPITNLNQINWGSGKYYLIVDFDINGTISSTAPEQLVTVPYSFYAGKAGNGMTAVADNGNGTLTFTYANGQTYVTPTLSGIQGPIGPAGPQGPQGPQGIQGVAGPAGATGPQGTIGLTGAVGPQGASGPAGINGTNGFDGKNTLAKTTVEAAGANCISGGVKIEYGLDTNADGTLDAGEINATLTKYVCNGSVGATGATGTQGPIGLTGPQGPQGIQGPAGPLVSGTSGQTLRNDGSTWVATSNLYNSGTSVGIGTTSPNSSAALEISSTTKGVLLPSMTQAQRNLITTPATGLLVFQNDNTPGFYFYNGTAWVAIGTAGGGSSSTSGSDSNTLIYTTTGF